ncbi:rna-directed dna polymerase from mobile element jockey-like [Pitangus sulphuratus]|nr:rna-directed dna polymerase from mobile element jockey-like [Pitangus sulphuratus]
MTIYKKGRKEHPGNYRHVSLTLVPEKVMEQIECDHTKHTKDNQGIRFIQYEFRKGRSCLTNLISFYDQVTCLVDEGKAVDVVYLDFSKAFDTVCTAYSWKSCQPMALTGGLFTGLRTG